MEQLLGSIVVLIGAVLSVSIAGAGSSIGISTANDAAAGVMTEDPSKFGYCLVLLALPGTQGIYGLLIAVLALQKIGLIGGTLSATLTLWKGLQIAVACLPVAFTGYASAVKQGKSSAAAILMISKHPDQIGKAVILPAMVETYAVFGLLVSILMLNGITL